MNETICNFMVGLWIRYGMRFEVGTKFASVLFNPKIEFKLLLKRC